MKTIKTNNLTIVSTTEEDFLEQFGNFKAKHFVFMGIPELPIYFDPYTRTAYVLSLDLVKEVSS